jgi:hypothetical protein
MPSHGEHGEEDNDDSSLDLGRLRSTEDVGGPANSATQLTFDSLVNYGTRSIELTSR